MLESFSDLRPLRWVKGGIPFAQFFTRITIWGPQNQGRSVLSMVTLNRYYDLFVNLNLDTPRSLVIGTPLPFEKSGATRKDRTAEMHL